jgi:hypothetical protein
METRQQQNSVIFSREVEFKDTCPYMDDILTRITQRTGIVPTYLADKWLVINPNREGDVFSLYQDSPHTLVLTHEGPGSDFVQATLSIVIELGGSLHQLDS